MLDELYQQVILDSSRSKRNRGDLSQLPSACREPVNNPLCGDKVDFWFDAADGIIRDVRFNGNGCAISQASASLMADLIRGKTFAEANLLLDDFQLLLHGEVSDEARDRLGSISALEGVKQFPIRMRCALLAFEALKRFLARSSQ